MSAILFLGGPTSAGKTAAAVALADEWNPRIVSADAMQVYRGLDIGTGKATPAERARVPHFAIDVVGIDEAFDATDFVAIADDVLATGGTVRGVADLIRQMGGEVVECAFLAELTFLKGRDKLTDLELYSLLQF